MRKETKQAFQELLQATKAELNNTENFYISHFMPETGVFETEEKDVDDNGNWAIVKGGVKITDDDALSEAQFELLNNEDQSYFDEFICEGVLREKMLSFMRELLRETVKC